MGLSIIIPFLDESENVENLTFSLNRFILDSGLRDTEVIFVDDGSQDDSVKKLKNIEMICGSKVVKLSRNFGSHAALRAGIKVASKDYICFVYADLQDPLELVKRLVDKMDEGYDLVFAYRNELSYGPIQKFFSLTYSKLMRAFVDANYPDKGFDNVMFNLKVRNVILQNEESNSSLFLQLLSLGFNRSFIAYSKTDRKYGKSKWTFSKKLKLFIDSFMAFSYAPIRLVSIAGILMFLFGIIWTLYIVLRHFISNDLAPGWPALVSILMIGFGLTNIFLGIIAEYLWRTLDASRKRPIYIIDEIIKLKNK